MDGQRTRRGGRVRHARQARPASCGAAHRRGLPRGAAVGRRGDRGPVAAGVPAPLRQRRELRVPADAGTGQRYLTISERPAWVAVAATCGGASAPGARPVPRRLRTRTVPEQRRGRALAPGASGGTIGPLLDPDPATAARRVLDFSVSSLEAGTPHVWSNPQTFSRHVRCADARATARRSAWGATTRSARSTPSAIFETAGVDGPEWRTVHLGLDLFVEAGTRVLAPLDGMVHSIADNAGPLNYGPTVILEHRADSDRPVRTWEPGRRRGSDVLHPVRSPVPRVTLALREGQHVARGTCFAHIGTAFENGGWPPHLHFQIVCDLLDRRGDFPGVARPSERRVWLSLSPDPNLVARFPEGVTAPRYASADESGGRAARPSRPSLSIVVPPATHDRPRVDAAPVRRGRPRVPRRRQQCPPRGPLSSARR